MPRKKPEKPAPPQPVIAFPVRHKLAALEVQVPTPLLDTTEDYLAYAVQAFGAGAEVTRDHLVAQALQHVFDNDAGFATWLRKKRQPSASV